MRSARAAARKHYEWGGVGPEGYEPSGGLAMLIAAASRAHDLLMGAEPTPEERDRHERAKAEREAYEAARADFATTLHEQSAQWGRVILNLHAMDEHGRCAGCDVSGYEAEQPEWPCRTVHLLAELRGITAPKHVPEVAEWGSLSVGTGPWSGFAKGGWIGTPPGERSDDAGE
jgi:hypothetical protein